MTQKTYTVNGMTCAHCVLAVREEVGDVAGIEAVEVDLATGRMEVRGARIDDAGIATAVAAAGYEVSPAG